MPLNPQLYRRLDSLLPGGVRSICKENEPAVIDPCSQNIITGARRKRRLYGGEEYVCLCPFCGDQKGHLYINHHYGDYDATTGEDNTHLVVCFRRNCLTYPQNRRALADKIFGDMPADRRRQLSATITAAPSRGAVHLTVTKAPGTIYRLSCLGPQHPAIEYLTRRQFEPAELETQWRVGYCSPPCDRLASNRLYVPVYMHGDLVGWQARWPDDLDWKHSNIRKYHNQAHFPRRLVLYGFDRALGKPLIVLTEGCTDVWRMGPPAVGLLGKTLSQPQCALLLKHWRDCPIAICLDNDDPQAPDAAQKIYGQLAAQGARRPFVVTLPPDKDPGDCGRDEVWACVASSAAREGIELPRPAGNEYRDILDAGSACVS